MHFIGSVTVSKLPAKKKPQKPWLRQTSLHNPHEAPTAPEPAIVGPRLLDRHEVCAIAAVSYPTLWAWMQLGKFPRSRIAGGKSKWLSTEVEQWMAALPIRKLKGDQ
jgi:predicted DNA-binding transcriptional regulator AlpA